MGNSISFRLNPKCASDRKILAWLEEKSSQPGYMNQTELIKQALITAMVQEEKGVKEKEATQWMDEEIHKAAEEFAKVVQETSQNVANNTFAGVMGAMMQQMNMGTMNFYVQYGKIYKNRCRLNDYRHPSSGGYRGAGN